MESRLFPALPPQKPYIITKHQSQSQEQQRRHRRRSILIRGSVCTLSLSVQFLHRMRAASPRSAVTRGTMEYLPSRTRSAPPSDVYFGGTGNPLHFLRCVLVRLYPTRLVPADPEHPRRRPLPLPRGTFSSEGGLPPARD